MAGAADFAGNAPAFRPRQACLLLLLQALKLLLLLKIGLLLLNKWLNQRLVGARNVSATTLASR